MPAANVLPSTAAVFLLAARKSQVLIVLNFVQNDWKCLKNVLKWVVISKVKRSLCIG